MKAKTNKKDHKLRNTIIITIVAATIIVAVRTVIVLKTRKNNPTTEGDSGSGENVNPPKKPQDDQNKGKEPKNPEQGNQEQENQDQQSSVGAKVLTGVGATLAGGTVAGIGTYVVNKVIERGKSSKVSPKDVNGEYVYLNSDGKEVIKTKEGEEIPKSVGTENEDVGDSGTKQHLEDKDAEEKKLGEETLENPESTNDDENNSNDEDKKED